MAAVLGIPGKIGTDGSMVLDLWKQGEIWRIRDYCETVVLTGHQSVAGLEQKE